MSLSTVNVVSASIEVAKYLAILLPQYRQIETDDTSTHHEIEMLDGQFGDILDRMDEVIKFAGQAEQTANMITDSLHSGLALISQIMKEKTRIIKTCAACTNPVPTQSYFSLN